MTSETSYPDRYDRVQRNAMRLGSAHPEVMTTFGKFHKAAVAEGALETKVKELIALAISVTARCDDCIAHHVHDALDAGATREEIVDAIGVAVLMGGGPGMIYGTHAVEALDQFIEMR
jgi:AhpD family alkylhydroperoxidase